MNMMRMSKWFVAVAVVLATTTGARAGDSAPFALDTRSGTRIARETESIAYSTEWSRGTDVQVSVDGVLLKTVAAPATGTVGWNAAEAGPGVHTLTHVSGGTTLTAQFAVFGVQAESADPAKGSITLAWTDLGSGETYSVYRGAGETRTDAVCVTNGLSGTTWTDNDYWCAEPVLKPLNYWVVAQGVGDGERESNRVETRHRFGVFVGVNKFKDGRFKLLPMLDTQAELFGQLARENGGCPDDNVKVLTGSKANKAAVCGAIRDVAEQAQTGDYVVIFCNSHGRADKPWFGREEFRGIIMYDTVKGKTETLYTKAELASDLEALATVNGKNGLNVAVFLNTCYSGGAVSASPAGQNFAWIVACLESEEATHFSAMGAVFPHFLLEYGWARGKAGGGAGTMATFADLWNYALPAMASFQKSGVDATEHPGCAETNVLKHFIAGELGNVTHEAVSGEPSAVTATVGEEEVTITWKGDGQADYYLVRRTNLDGSQPIVDVKDECIARDVEVSWYGKTYLYQVSAMNEWGVSGWSSTVNGSRLLRDLEMWIRGYFDLSADATPEALETAAASTAANGSSYEACYVAGLDPKDPSATFEAELSFEEEKWKVKPVGGEKEGRVYRVEGKREMTDEEWEDVTDVEDLEAEGWRFFRVGVGLAK